MDTSDGKTYEELSAEVRLAQADGRLPQRPTQDDIIDWAWGQAKFRHPDMTREEAESVIKAPMTPEQERAQRISFAFGNVSMHNPAVTREMIERLADEVK